MATYFLPRTPIPLTAFGDGLRFTVDRGQSIEQAVTSAKARYIQRLGHEPRAVFVPAALDTATVAGLPVRVAAAGWLPKNGFELR